MRLYGDAHSAVGEQMSGERTTMFLSGVKTGIHRRDKVVSDREIQVWQDGGVLKIESRYADDPRFTLEQEKAFHEIARNILIANRKRESDKRRKENAKKKKTKSDEVTE